VGTEPVNDRRHARAERAQDMYQAYLRGMTLAEVGALYGLGPERVRQLFFMTRLPTRKREWRPPGHPQRDSYLATRP
jgi:sigma-70-like protein